MATTTTEKSESKQDKADKADKDTAVAAIRERDPAREKAIDVAVSTIEKQFGKGSIMRLGEGMAPPEVKVIPTGSLGLDIALGVGGLPRGRVIEVYGPESSGKTTLALHVVSEAQRLQNLNFITVDQFGNFVDARTAQAFQLNNNNFALNDNVVRRKSATIRANLLSGRDTFTLDLSHQISITESTGAEQTTISAAGNWARAISDVGSLNVTLRFLNTDAVPSMPGFRNSNKLHNSPR